MAQDCPECGKPASMFCSRCRTVAFCGKACFTTHWPKHKSACTPHPDVIRATKLTTAKAFLESSVDKFRDAISHVAAARSDVVLRIPQTLESFIDTLDPTHVHAYAVKSSEKNNTVTFKFTNEEITIAMPAIKSAEKLVPVHSTIVARV